MSEGGGFSEGGYRRSIEWEVVGKVEGKRRGLVVALTNGMVGYKWDAYIHDCD